MSFTIYFLSALSLVHSLQTSLAEGLMLGSGWSILPMTSTRSEDLPVMVPGGRPLQLVILPKTWPISPWIMWPQLATVAMEGQDTAKGPDIRSKAVVVDILSLKHLNKK